MAANAIKELQAACAVVRNNYRRREDAIRDLEQGHFQGGSDLPLRCIGAAAARVRAFDAEHARLRDAAGERPGELYASPTSDFSPTSADPRRAVVAVADPSRS
eukprot:gene26924-46979_t